MRALVISGGGSKGAFGGGVAQYLLQEKRYKYDLFIGSSTGSILVPHLALGNIDKIHGIYTNVDMKKIFNVNPFVIKKKDNTDFVSISHFNVMLQFLKGRRTFGESHRLRYYLRENFSLEEFNQLKSMASDVVVTVTNFSTNEVEYKSVKDFDYDEFCDWIWISCNYIPFMSMISKDSCDYGDGGFSSSVPIREAIKRGATEIDVVILETEMPINSSGLGKNMFTLMIDLFQALLIQVEKHNITIGKLAAKNKNVKLNLYYTPTQLTNNCLIFDKEKMSLWWRQGFEYAKNKNELRKDNLQ